MDCHARINLARNDKPALSLRGRQDEAKENPKIENFYTLFCVCIESIFIVMS
ncbi:hypothetical protein [Helicobacter fennelliae]|uniref:Uncharacterized protein n=1 Tax=Helicobacter fennelliae MRY12-0050 TaxID=1325130 RepID=T1CPZ4_9HELI|nr:hypothetical protein [Helicobacter fennelliae]GAD18829.1 hypothetical protein HFN_2241 [Helicobacter fennelliae MRY12-0050]